MAKLIAGVLKKLPVPGVEFSNQQFSGGLEVELPDGADDGTIRQRLRELYATLSTAVEAEIAAAAEAAREADMRTRFPNPDGNPGGAAPESDNRRHGYNREDRERSRNRGYGEDGRGQGYRRGSGAEDRDRSYPRNHDGGRGNYRERNARDDGRDDGRRSGNSWRERGGGNGGSRDGAATQAQVRARPKTRCTCSGKENRRNSAFSTENVRVR